jgi:hypothetical protein
MVTRAQTAQTAQQAQLAQTLILIMTRNRGLRQQQAQTARTVLMGQMAQLENQFLLLLFLYRWRAELVAKKD